MKLAQLNLVLHWADAVTIISKSYLAQFTREVSPNHIKYLNEFIPWWAFWLFCNNVYLYHCLTKWYIHLTLPCFFACEAWICSLSYRNCKAPVTRGTERDCKRNSSEERKGASNAELRKIAQDIDVQPTKLKGIEEFVGLLVMLAWRNSQKSFLFGQEMDVLNIVHQ